MSIKVIRAENARARRDFLDLPHRIYAGNQFWVPPLRAEMKRIIDPKANGHLRKGPCALFVAYRDGRPAGRLMAGADRETNAVKEADRGWFSLFEAEEDYGVAAALLEAAKQYLLTLGVKQMVGPVSPTGGDDYRGLLINAFTSPPVLMESYNPPYYREFFETYGLGKEKDLYAYYFQRRPPRNQRAVAYAEKRYGFRLDRLDLAHLDREVKDIKKVIDLAMPAEWPDLAPPSLEEVKAMADSLKAFADPAFVLIARAAGEPVGFNVTIPDLNQVLIHLRGGLWPLGWLKFLYWRRRINGLRFFVLFVVPAWRQRGVSAAIFNRTYEEALRKGITWGEGSTIGEDNYPMRHDVERAGGVHYKTYRIYQLNLG